MSLYSQCFICREWSWAVSKSVGSGVELCLPCYVDVLEVKQARGSMGAVQKPRSTPSARERVHPTPESDGSPGSAPSPLRQLELFKVECPYCDFETDSPNGVATHFGKMHRGTYNLETHRVEN